MAKLEKSSYPGNWGGEEEQAELDKIWNKSLALPADQILEGVLRFPVADGYAFYVVTKEKPLTVQWVPFGDQWSAPDPLIRGLNRNDVEQMLHRERKLKELFTQKAQI